MRFTENDVNRIKAKAEKEPGFIKFTWYSNYCEVLFKFDKNTFKGIDPPQWTKIDRIKTIGEEMYITVSIWNGDLFCGIELLEKYSILGYE